MSTNDTVLLLASGASGVAPEHDEFAEAVRDASATTSARQLIGDAEGASKDIRIEVDQRRDRGRRRRGGPLHRPQQPPQVRHPRRGPQLGPGAVRHRHHRRRLRARPAERRHQRRLGLQERRRRRGPRPGRHALPRGHDHRRPRRRAPSPPSSGPTTSPPTTSTRTARTPHEQPRAKHTALPKAADPHRGAALADPAPRQDRRHQVRRQRHGRRGAEGRLRPGRRLPAPRRAQARSSCTAAARRSAPSSTGSAWSASSRRACGSPPPRPWTSYGWCWPARSSASWSACSTSTGRSPSA